MLLWNFSHVHLIDDRDCVRIFQRHVTLFVRWWNRIRVDYISTECFFSQSDGVIYWVLWFIVRKSTERFDDRAISPTTKLLLFMDVSQFILMTLLSSNKGHRIAQHHKDFITSRFVFSCFYGALNFPLACQLQPNIEQILMCKLIWQRQLS